MPESLLSNVVELNSIYLFSITTAEPKAERLVMFFDSITLCEELR